MSTLEVNKITPVSGGTSITLGDSGDTFTIPSGVTITNNGTQTGFGKIGQVVANHITTQTSSSSSSFADVGGSETTIVTTATTSKVLLSISLSCRKFNNMYLALDLYRKIGSGSYSKIRDFENGFLFTNSTATNTGRFAVSFLDEPASADTIKYKMQFNSGPNGASVVINPDAQETSSIILQEVLA